MPHRTLSITAICAAALLPWPLGAEGAPKLRQAGALHCDATRARGPAVTALRCELRLPDVDVKRGTFTGEMFGTGVHVVYPGGIRVVWNVLAPTTRLHPSMIAGEYDMASKHGFPYAEDNSDLLVGGHNDMVALELVTPVLDAVTPETRLVLRQNK